MPFLALAPIHPSPHATVISFFLSHGSHPFTLLLPETMRFLGTCQLPYATVTYGVEVEVHNHNLTHS